MNSLHAGTLGIVAALAGTLADSDAALASESRPLAVTSKPPAGSSVDLYDAPDAASGAQGVPAQRKIGDGKRMVVALPEEALPGASQILGVLLHTAESGMSITSDHPTFAVTFAVMPTKMGRGKGLVAIAKF